MTTGTADELTSRAQARVGSVLRGKYRLDRILGIGGMAVVYAATHRNRKRFAVKMLHPELSVNTEIRTRFLREGYVANSVEHPGAVAVLDDDVAEDGAAFIVMELLDGAGVEQLWERYGHHLPVQVVLAVGYQLLDVLAAAHARSIVHRDIKPANLFLTRDGTLKVLDFGIARLRDATSEHATQTGMMMGTPAFMAPEQAQGQSNQIDGLTDVWAVGATMFSLLSGSTVHEGDNAQRIVIQAATQPARSLSTAVVGVPEPVVRLVDRALAFDRASRWPSAGAARDATRETHRALFGSDVLLRALAELLGSGDAEPVAGYAIHNANPVPITPQSPGQGAGLGGTATPVVASVDGAPARAASGPISGGTTAQPTSSNPDEDRVVLPRSTFARFALPAVALACALGAGAVAASRLSGGASPATPGVAGDSPPSSPAAPAGITGPVQSSTAATIAPIVLQPPTSPLPSVRTAPNTGSQPFPLPHVAPSSSIAAAAPPHKALASSPVASTVPATCRVVSYFDSEGNKRFKEECQ